MSQYFSFDGDNFQTHNTLAQAMKDAQEAIDCYADQCDPEWPDEVQSVCYGLVLGHAICQPASQDEIENAPVIAGHEDTPFVNYVIDDPYGEFMKQPAELTERDERYHYTEIVQALADKSVTMMPGILSEVVTLCCQRSVFRSPLAMLNFAMRAMAQNGVSFPVSLLEVLGNEIKKELQGQVKS